MPALLRLSFLQITFELQARDALLLYFFAAMGLNSDIKSLFKGGNLLSY